jgi:ADP-heptose:LPS heptosyltransferase
MVVSVPTTIYHLAGALGKPAMVLVHDQPHFHEGIAGDCPWWESVKFYRRPELGTENAVLAIRDSIINSLRDTRTGEVKVG